MTAPPEEQNASIISIEVLTREATFRRLAELAHRTDRPPREVEEAALALNARVAPAFRSIDDELAALAYDSDHDPQALENVRSLSSSTRRLTFQAPELVLEVEVTLGRPRTLFCQVLPPQPAVLEVRLESGTLRSQTDPFGTFHVASVPPGPLSLRCSPQGQDVRHPERPAPVATSWIRI
ncbi:MAG: hypothetical protein ACLPQS_13290 [Acidimicrobiales bacterium]